MIPAETSPFRTAVVTGTRAEFGLLEPVMRAIWQQPMLCLQLVVSGAHLLGDSNTIQQIENTFEIHARVPMQLDSENTGRSADVQAFARGVAGFGEAFDTLDPHVVMVLGDRIEAFAAASAASIGGRTVAHIHGGDRAEGVADEAMRHAITKLAHLHFPATAQSEERIIRMGEDPRFVWCVGSPAIDSLTQIPPATNEVLESLDLPGDRAFALILHHPADLGESVEADTMHAIIRATESHAGLSGALILSPNHDPGRKSVLSAIGQRRVIPNLPREQFISLLKRAALLIGNSSAGLIESSAVGTPAVNIGPRQGGRERPPSVVDVSGTPPREADISRAIDRALELHPPFEHPYGDGQTGPCIAKHLAELLAAGPLPSIRKRNLY